MTSAYLARGLRWLERYGLLLAADPRLPSVTTLVSGGPIQGSWWGHPQAHEIFAVAEALEGHRDALSTKLVLGKVTYVHRRLWPAVAGVGGAREDWQLQQLSPPAQRLWSTVERAGVVRTDQLPAEVAGPGTVGDWVRELEKRLLVVSQEIHTETGAHAKSLEGWHAWADRIGFQEPWMSALAGKEELERVLGALNREFGARGCLPWQGR